MKKPKFFNCLICKKTYSKILQLKRDLNICSYNCLEKHYDNLRSK